MNTYLHTKIFVLAFILFVINFNSCVKSATKLKDGDLLFKQKIDDKFAEAIISATTSIEKYQFTHVGIAHNIGNNWFVIEAVSSGVCLTPLDYFIGDTSIVVIGRLVDKYEKDIPKAIDNIMKTIGKPYDKYFSPHNDSFYCSELVQQFYLHDNKPIFSTIKMTFKDLKTGEFPEFWKKHFELLNSPIPEGESGSNPGNLSKSDKIKILGVIN